MKEKVTKLQRFLQVDSLLQKNIGLELDYQSENKESLSLLSGTNPYFNPNYSNEDYVVNFFCVHKLGFGKQCSNGKKCKDHWNEEWEGEVIREEIPVSQSNNK